MNFFSAYVRTLLLKRLKSDELNSTDQDLQCIYELSNCVLLMVSLPSIKVHEKVVIYNREDRFVDTLQKSWSFKINFKAIKFFSVSILGYLQ